MLFLFQLPYPLQDVDFSFINKFLVFEPNETSMNQSFFQNKYGE